MRGLTRRLPAWLFLAASLPWSGCAPRGAENPGAAQTTGPLQVVGPRCEGGACRCRKVDDYGADLEPTVDEQVSASGQKRFELRTSRTMDEVAITVAGRGTLTKPAGTNQPACGYVDLPPGQHRVKIRAKASDPEQGMVPGAFISEYGSDTKSWYATFQVRCGGEEQCQQGHMDDWIGAVQRKGRGIWDPCGSTRVTGVKWNALNARGPQLADLEIELVLDVYKFAPRFPHGAPKCKGVSAGAPE
jgi:hypothetical protein